MSYLQKAKQMNALMQQGKIYDVLEQYYADDCIIVEKPTGEERHGKAAQKKAIDEWYEMVKEFHGETYGFVTSNEKDKVTMVQSSTEITMMDGNRTKMEEIAVQTWNEKGQIVREEFYYQLGPPPQMG